MKRTHLKQFRAQPALSPSPGTLRAITAAETKNRASSLRAHHTGIMHVRPARTLLVRYRRCGVYHRAGKAEGRQFFCRLPLDGATAAAYLNARLLALANGEC
jgi:hypothetical protein